MIVGKGTLSLEKEYNVLVAICTSLYADLSYFWNSLTCSGNGMPSPKHVLR